MGRPRGVIWQEFTEAENDVDTGKERVKCKHCERVVSKRAHRLQQHLVGCKAYARAIELKLTTDEALQAITRSSSMAGMILAAAAPSAISSMPLEPPPGLHLMGAAGNGGEGSAGRRQLEPTTTGRQLETQQIYEAVKAYYGLRMQRSTDFILLSGCAAQHAMSNPLPPLISQVMTKVPIDVLQRYSGCGMPVPLGIDGLRVLDLGCGAGRDTFIAAALVGPRGFVLGVDICPQQIEVAERSVEEFNSSIGSRQSNVRFVEGQMEYLEKVGVIARSIDLVIANCAFNLSPMKEQVLKEVIRVLRPGGELQFTDIFSSRRLPESVRKDDVLYSECFGGALYTEDFKRLCRQLGFGEPRELSRTPMEIKSGALADMVGLASFYSITYRCFKTPNLESGELEEDYGHVATYLGTIPGLPHGYQLDAAHFFESLRPVRVGGNTAAILKHSWLKKYFNVHGDWAVHFGTFDPSMAGQPSVPSDSLRSNGLPRRTFFSTMSSVSDDNYQKDDLNGHGASAIF
ncbi:hypothetical protein PINS_up017554 [Pythium insidiosum]|nr:hypothetical protein PINS_up017554 [Pythium insidiosum]